MQKLLLMSDPYIKARDTTVGKKLFISQIYSTREEALAVLAAFDAKKFMLGANQFERRVLEIYSNSREVYDQFIRGDYIKDLSSGKFQINLHLAEHDAKKSIEGAVGLNEKEFVKLLKNTDVLNHQQTRELARCLAKNPVFCGLWRYN